MTTVLKTVAVTGSSSGIGRATAVYLASRGHRLVVGARRTDQLDALTSEIRRAGGTVDPVRLDVTDRQDVQGFVEEAVRLHGGLDVLVNNAGVMPLSPLEALQVGEWDRMIDVNIRGLLHGVAAALPLFRRQGSGHFVTIASVGAHAVSPTAAVYCGTKYAAWAITEGLRQEVGDSIKVTTISPGVVESELADSISDAGTAELMRSYREVSVPAEAIGHAIGYAIEQPDGVDVNEIVIRPTGQV